MARERPEYSFAKGNYTLYDSEDSRSGVSDGIGNPAMWNDISRYVSAVQAAIVNGYEIRVGDVLPLTTKGDLLTRTATDLVRLAVGATRDQPVIVDPDAAEGLRWATNSWNPFRFRKFLYWVPRLSMTGAPVWDDFGDTGTGTNVTANGTGTNNKLIDSTGYYAQMSGGAVNNEDVGYKQTNTATFNLVQTVLNPVLCMAVKIGAAATDITTVRYWYGLFSALPNASNTPLAHYAAFRYSAAIDGANWQAVTDNGSGAPTVTNTGVAIATNTRYEMGIDILDNTSIKFYINGTLVATHTTKLPGTTTSLTWQCLLRQLNTTSRTVRVGQVVMSVN